MRRPLAPGLPKRAAPPAGRGPTWRWLPPRPGLVGTTSIVPDPAVRLRIRVMIGACQRPAGVHSQHPATPCWQVGFRIRVVCHSHPRGHRQALVVDDGPMCSVSGPAPASSSYYSESMFDESPTGFKLRLNSKGGGSLQPPPAHRWATRRSPRRTAVAVAAGAMKAVAANFSCHGPLTGAALDSHGSLNVETVLRIARKFPTQPESLLNP